MAGIGSTRQRQYFGDYGDVSSVSGGSSVGSLRQRISGQKQFVPDPYKPDIQAQQKQYQQSIEQLKGQAKGVQAAAGRAAKMADFFAPERGRYIQGLRQLMTGGESAIAADPSYQFRYKQGQQAVESSLAAQGLLGSGSAGLELQQYGQQAASQEYQAQYERLFQLAGVGQSDPTAAAQLMFQGAQAPMQAMEQIAGYGFQGVEAERGRAFEQSQAALQQQYALERMQFEGGGFRGGGRRGPPPPPQLPVNQLLTGTSRQYLGGINRYRYAQEQQYQRYGSFGG